MRSLGTEGRRGDPSLEVPAVDNVYDYVVFRASDVKDLQIEQAEPAPPPPIQDPAVLNNVR